MFPDNSPQNIIIVGGGFSGTLVAVHLLRGGFNAPIDIVEPRALGRGLAYSTPWDDHLLNVPAIRMSAFGSEPLHFLEWLRANGMPQAAETTFAPRKLYGAYIQSVLESEVRHSTVPLRHHFTSAAGINWETGYADVTLADGQHLRGSRVVVASGNSRSRPLSDEVEGCVNSPFDYGALAGLDADGEVLLVGSGLTAVDALLALRAQGHRGIVHAVSRRGVLPRIHESYVPATGAFRPSGASGALHLLRAIRAKVTTAAQQGTDWRAIIDSIRPATNEIWAELDVREKGRVQGHLKVWWDSHRHRVAPDVGAQLTQELREKRFIMHAGRLGRISPAADALNVSLRLRSGAPLELKVQRILNCTGSNDNLRESSNSFVQSLLTGGYAQPGDLGKGFRTSPAGQLVDASGIASNWLFALGPLRVGDLFETVAVPELRYQAEALAHHLLAITSEPVEVSAAVFMAMGI